MYLLTFIFQLYLNEGLTHKHACNSSNLHSPNIMYTAAELLNLKPKVYIAKMYTDVLQSNKNLKLNVISEGKEEGQKYVHKFETIIIKFTITYCGH